MSTKIDLTISRHLDIDLLDKGITFWTVRTKVQIKLKKIQGGWTRAYEALIDTGAPISIIPQKIWEGIEREIIGEDILRGVIPNKRCFLPVKIASVVCFLMDRVRESRPINFRSYLAPIDELPLIMGMDLFLSEAVLHLDYLQKKGFIEI